MKNYRQGDIGLVGVAELPKDLEVSDANILLQEGSGGNPHTFQGGKFYPKLKDNQLGFLVAENTKLVHVEHSPNGDEIENGIYQIIRQNEETHEGLKPVVD